MKPFNLEKAKAGKPVQTKDGQNARILCFDARNPNGEKYIVALIGNVTEYVNTYSLDGRFLYGNNSSDLVMVPVKKSGWINMYRNEDDSIGTGALYASEQEAIEGSRVLSHLKRIATIQIEWEE